MESFKVSLPLGWQNFQKLLSGVDVIALIPNKLLVKVYWSHLIFKDRPPRLDPPWLALSETGRVETGRKPRILRLSAFLAEYKNTSFFVFSCPVNSGAAKNLLKTI